MSYGSTTRSGAAAAAVAGGKEVRHRARAHSVISLFGVPGTLGSVGASGGGGGGGGGGGVDARGSTLLVAFVADIRYGSPIEGIFRDLDAGARRGVRGAGVR